MSLSAIDFSCARKVQLSTNFLDSFLVWVTSNRLRKAPAQNSGKKTKILEAEKAEYVQFGVLNCESQKLLQKI
jgi:hypothetical protein